MDWCFTQALNVFFYIFFAVCESIMLDHASKGFLYAYTQKLLKHTPPCCNVRFVYTAIVLVSLRCRYDIRCVYRRGGNRFCQPRAF